MSLTGNRQLVRLISGSKRSFYRFNTNHRIIRIFIINQAEKDLYKDFVLEQLSFGIEVRIAIQEDLPQESLEAFILYDDYAVRTEELISGINKNSVLSLDKNEVRAYQRKFEELYLRSIPLDHIYPDISLSHAPNQ